MYDNSQVLNVMFENSSRHERHLVSTHSIAAVLMRVKMWKQELLGLSCDCTYDSDMAAAQQLAIHANVSGNSAVMGTGAIPMALQHDLCHACRY